MRTVPFSAPPCIPRTKILLHLACQESVQLSAVAQFKIPVKLCEEFCVKLIVVSGYNGVINMNCKIDFGGGAVRLFDFFLERHAFSVEVFESVMF